MPGDFFSDFLMPTSVKLMELKTKTHAKGE